MQLLGCSSDYWIFKKLTQKLTKKG